MALLLDITDLPEQHANSGLELMHKAMSEGADGFVPHENPYLTQLVEMFHARGVTQLDAMWNELLDILHGKHVFDPNASHGRLTQAELSLLEQLLKMGDPNQYTVNDWMLLVDYWLERYLPPSFAVSQAAWLTARAVFMGRLQASMANPPTDIERALSMAPMQPMNPTVEKIIEFGQAHATENIVTLSDSVRRKVKADILNHLEEKSLSGQLFTTGVEGLQSRLFDRFGEANTDWRRIAVTEAGEMANQAYVAGQPPGTRLKRIEMYRNACQFCQKINGLVVTVVDPEKPYKDPWKEIWAGKTNIGRSSSPMKKVGDKLVPRSPDELWWPAAGVQHVSCRGSWTRADIELRPGDDPELARFMQDLWDKAGKEMKNAAAV